MGCKKLDDQGRLGKLKTMDGKAMLQIIEANTESRTQRELGEISISLSSVVCLFHNHGKFLWSYRILFHITKILHNF